jgi:cell division protease FtsH
LDDKQSDKTFDDIGGNTEVKEAIREIIDYIKNPSIY